LPEEEKDKK